MSACITKQSSFKSLLCCNQFFCNTSLSHYINILYPPQSILGNKSLVWLNHCDHTFTHKNVSSMLFRQNSSSRSAIQLVNNTPIPYSEKLQIILTNRGKIKKGFKTNLRFNIKQCMETCYDRPKTFGLPWSATYTASTVHYTHYGYSSSDR